MPYYARTRCSLVEQTINWGTPSVCVPADISQPLHALSIYSKGNLGTYALYRSFADDFQLSYFLGCPPVAYGYA